MSARSWPRESLVVAAMFSWMREDTSRDPPVFVILEDDMPTPEPPSLWASFKHHCCQHRVHTKKRRERREDDGKDDTVGSGGLDDGNEVSLSASKMSKSKKKHRHHGHAQGHAHGQAHLKFVDDEVDGGGGWCSCCCRASPMKYSYAPGGNEAEGPGEERVHPAKVKKPTGAKALGGVVARLRFCCARRKGYGYSPGGAWSSGSVAISVTAAAAAALIALPLSLTRYRKRKSN